ncbi:MAG: replication-associated recombination protein A [Succinivibrio dextrinosolvens]|uniref:replication-associated recombination protein A n=1 Tax=Succinivibrio sp. TaxID=2053619 RepID=UPI0025FE037B|nr:replication-associated recombination protein A [Succinivibrio sp.]MDY6415840.1 replication-associated recombination protein A [Succinivibrio dextrinosolvens]MBQ9221036.1 replication-associated recombination protein A [Succinivibrio sp.]MDY6420475.1 replication-associated recombination protein A [Succinivibrio dextrinosolvens]MDY6465168.1 replication-associated recombination protein A [Succinivibrio dextrinosolvens]MDY6469922.1 replication-associated recombination protein A [Succinivibrio de
MSANQTDLFAAIEQEQKDKDSLASSEQLDAFAPLASRLRPQSVDEYIGQSHLIAKGRPLRALLDKGQCYSMVLWGPPGVGKTTLALLFAKSCNAYFEQIPAVTSGIKDIRDAVDRALLRKQRGVKTLLFVDEVHRFNKTQQDAFLPHIENGTITFIGATTENPSFSLNSALLSRARVYVLQKLNEDESKALIQYALNSERGLKKEEIHLADGVEKAIVDLAAGDARYLLNILEMASDLAAPYKEGGKILTLAMVGAVAGRKLINYDKNGDAYYELISAFHKSVRGSAADAALYWYSRILEAGGDPLYVARRLLAIATEDIGLADPRAMTVCLNAWDIFERVGPAEGERAIAEATVYCALAPKSNHLYEAFGRAREDARTHGDLEVPIYLRNAPTKLMEDMGYKKGYRYAHDYEGAYAAGESFFPEELTGTVYYHPSDRGAEVTYTKKIEYLRQRDAVEQDKRYPDGFVGKKVTHR